MHDFTWVELADCEMERAWAAGFFDGEGNVSISTRGYLLVQIAQCDQEPLIRFQHAVRCGRVLGPYRRAKCKPFWVFQVTNNDDGQLVYARLRPYLCGTKREQWDLALGKIKPTKRTRPRKIVAASLAPLK